MAIKTFEELIDWTRQLHAQLGHDLAKSASNHEQERERLLLDYLAGHEAEIATMVAEFEHQADPKALNTYIYDFVDKPLIEACLAKQTPYVEMRFDEICGTVFDWHEQVIDLYQGLAKRADIPEATTLFEGLLAMETQEIKRLAQQTARMNDL